MEELCSHDLFYIFSLFYRGVCIIVYFLVTEWNSLVLVRVKACEVGYFVGKKKEKNSLSSSVSKYIIEQFIKYIREIVYIYK